MPQIDINRGAQKRGHEHAAVKHLDQAAAPPFLLNCGPFLPLLIFNADPDAAGGGGDFAPAAASVAGDLHPPGIGVGGEHFARAQRARHAARAGFRQDHFRVAALKPDAAGAALQIERPGRDHVFQCEPAGAAGGYLSWLGYPSCRGRKWGRVEKDKGQYDTIAEVDWTTGACMCVRTQVYKELGGLDASFFAHMEEIDLCWRLKNAGFKVYCCPQSWVFHIGGGTLPKNSPRKTYLNFRNNLSLLVKNLPKHRVHRIILYRIFLDWVAAFKFLIEGCPKDFRMVFKAHWDFYKRLKELREKRRCSEHKLVSCIYRKNIVFESIVRGKKKFSELKKSSFT